MIKILNKKIIIYNTLQELLDIFRIPRVTNYLLTKFFKLFIANVNFKYIGRFSKINLNYRSILGNNITLGDYSTITNSKDGILEILDDIKIAKNVLISSDFGGKIFIGKGTIIGPNTVIRSANHKLSKKNYESNIYDSKDIIIGNGCWIGANSVILGGTVLGDNCVVGALSVTNKNYGNASLICGSIATAKR